MISDRRYLLPTNFGAPSGRSLSRTCIQKLLSLHFVPNRKRRGVATRMPREDGFRLQSRAIWITRTTLRYTVYRFCTDTLFSTRFMRSVRM
jgi:hypothetical protein